MSGAPRTYRARSTASISVCDTGRPVASGVPWREVDITTDPDLEAEYTDRIPVVLLDGREHGYWRVEEARLLRDLMG